MDEWDVMQQPRCPQCGTVMRDVLNEFECGGCGLVVVNGVDLGIDPPPPTFDGPSIHGG